MTPWYTLKPCPHCGQPALFVGIIDFKLGQIYCSVCEEVIQ